MLREYLHINKRVFELRNRIRDYAVSSRLEIDRNTACERSKELLNYYESMSYIAKQIIRRAEELNVCFDNFYSILTKCNKEDLIIIETILECEIPKDISERSLELSEICDVAITKTLDNLFFFNKQNRYLSKIMLFNKTKNKEINIKFDFQLDDKYIRLINDMYIYIYNQLVNLDRYINNYIRDLLIERISNFNNRDKDDIYFEIIKNIDNLNQCVKSILSEISDKSIRRNLIHIKSYVI